MNTVKIRDLDIKFPIYLPDATRAVTKGLDSKDLENTGIEGVVVNTYHLSETPGLELLENTSGVKNFMNFKGLVVSDSGGWQVFSLIHRSNKKGTISDDGVVFYSNNNKKRLFTPEESIQIQFKINSDVIICLDDFTNPNAPEDKVRESVERTILWASRCKKEYERILKVSNIGESNKPLLFSVIQGGWNKELRRYCAEKLIEIGFDGYGYGGYAIDDNNHQLDLELSKFIADLIPDNKIKFALGVGKPHDIAALSQMGWQIFDCTLPTRDARHRRLYTFAYEPKSYEDLLKKDLYKYVYLQREVYKNDFSKPDETCDCPTCLNHSKAYLYHLFKIGDTSAYRLASIHNLRHYTKLINYIRDFKK